MLTIRVPKWSGVTQPIMVDRWYRQVGEAIARGAVLLDLRVGNQLFSIKVPCAGIVDRQLVTTHQVVQPDRVLAIIKDGLPVFDPKAPLDMESVYALDKKELTVSSQLEIQQLLIEQAQRYAARIQSLPPRWESMISPDSANGMLVDHNGLKTHPLFAEKAWRREEHHHPADMPREHIEEMRLSYDPEYQAQPKFNPTPSPGR